MPDARILKGQTLSFRDDPFRVAPAESIVHESHGAVRIEDGRIAAVGPADRILAEAGDIAVEDHGRSLIMAGFVDCHVHYPQTPIIASYGAQLLDWLNTYTFPAEARFADPAVCRAVAETFLDEILRNGITSAAVYGTVHPQSVDGFFEAAAARGLRMAAGKVCMDRHAPDELTDDATRAYDESKALIERWHGRDRSGYILTPRFAPTSTADQLAALGALWREFPDVLMQTHLSENRDEIAWVKRLFPQARDYLGVYEAFGLIGPGAIFGHGIWLEERERALLRERGAALAHCPTSNLFIGSGLFDMAGLRAGAAPVCVGLGTDVGGGSSFSMFATMKAAYEIAQLGGYSLHPIAAYWLATVGSARTMRLDDRIGNLAPGYEADLVVIDLTSRPVIEQRMRTVEDIGEALFVQLILADDRAIAATYSGGRKVHERAV
ncbi:guanine deaminase [Oceanibacterium hippocampi]|uniref:Guanine deaminase n=1 Tax=Oceanibacterium hippocampi TaxID=745714 RepID=A0A1Y5TX89_9PROT|nr:guanine deaminase [Oceanibacterium hippocampi]SLN76014.1 Guanine deaminase [Oceanibacterium hippocampi]